MTPGAGRLEPEQRSIRVAQDSDVAAVRSVLQEAAGAANLDVEVARSAALVATELATNLVRHAGGGRIVLGVSGADVEILSLDRGPGLPSGALQEREPAAAVPGRRGLGVGLGAVRRLSRVVDAHSDGGGTVLYARLGAPATEGPLRIAGISLPLRPIEPCGDAWCVVPGPHGVAVMVADGLGHGAPAALASRAAVAEFLSRHAAGPQPLLDAMHAALAKLRGAAVAAAWIDVGRGELTFSGVGNVAGRRLAGGDTAGLISRMGIVGGTMAPSARVHPVRVSWNSGATLVLASDGLGTQWKPDRVLAARHPAVAAGVLLRDHARDTDDVTVVVVRG